MKLTGYDQSRVAEVIARAAHDRQVDKGGKPYFEHPSRVARAVVAAGYGAAHIAVAYLHDVVEDTAVTQRDLALLGFSPEVLEAVFAITQQKKEHRDSYYARVLRNPIAKVVKVYDVQDNASPERMALLSEETQARLGAKYKYALELLEA